MKEGRMVALKVRDIAEQQGLTMYALQQRAGVSMGAIRRYWYSSADGKEHGRPLRVVYLEQLGAVAEALGVQPGDLLRTTEGEQHARGNA
jgi:transcriptional regulator with XRE-family HTH domain